MKHAELVTFGGSGMDRAAEIRGNGALLDEARVSPMSTTILLWRGKLLISGKNRDHLVKVAMDHSALKDAGVPPILLGRDDEGYCFAHNLTHWTPEEIDDAAFDSFLDKSEQHHPAFPADHLFCELRGIMINLSARDAELAATAKALFNWHKTHKFCAMCGAPSDMTMAGWQRSCVACGGQHFPRTDPVVIMLITHGNKVLIGRSPGWPEGMYSLLAGFVEPGETLEAAVRREVFEEAGIRVGHVDYLASQPWAFPSSLMFGCSGKALNDDITIDPHEIEDAVWVSREEIMQSFAGTHPFIKPAREGAIAHFILRNWLADRLD